MSRSISSLAKTLARTVATLVLRVWSKFKSPFGSLNRSLQRTVSALMISGIIAFFFSMVINSSVLAFIGLGLILWGILFLFAKPSAVAVTELTNSTLVPSMMIIDRTMSDLEYQNGVYIPPGYIKNFGGGVLLLRNEDSRIIERVVKERKFPNPLDTYILPPPGIGVVNLLEKQLKVDFSEKDFDFLRNNLTKLLVDLEMAKSLDIEMEGNTIHATVVGSVLSGVCADLRKRQTLICTSVGCPLCSALAYALAKAIKKPVVIERNEISSDGMTIEAWYKTIEDLN